MKKTVLVVGAGLGGMAAAIRLANAGYRVEVWEKNDQVGGKLKQYQQDGFTWDTGPSLMTMPHVLQNLFYDVGENINDFLHLEKLASTCRYFWSDGTQVDENETFWKCPEVEKFLTYARGIYELSGEAYLNYPPEDFWRGLQPKNWKHLRHLPKVANFRSLAQEVDRYFSDPYLRQLFYRFATYNGSSPFLTPSTFNIIPYVEACFGGWYVQGGMVSIARALGQLAHKKGVQFFFQTEVVSWQKGEVSSVNGKKMRPDFLVCNGDVLQAARGWLQEAFSDKQQKRMFRPVLSTSGLIFFWGVKKRFSQLRHHNIFFSDDYPQEFADIFQRKIWPSQPTIYVCITSRHEAVHAPEGCDNYFVLINTPAGSEAPGALSAYRQQVVRRLENMGLIGLSEEIVTEKVFTPHDFAQRDLTYGGALYGWASHSISTALFRPSLQSQRVRNLYFVGGTTHPGGGIPLVLLSGKMVAEKILRQNFKNRER